MYLGVAAQTPSNERAWLDGFRLRMGRLGSPERDGICQKFLFIVPIGQVDIGPDVP